MNHRSNCALFFAAVLAPSLVWGQSDDLADLIPNLFARDIFLAPPGPGFPSHETHFQDEAGSLAVTGQAINQSISAQLATFPFPSSGAGFTYTYEPTVGVFSRTSESFGPLFAERAQTIGKGKWNLGFNYSRATYDSIDNLDLENGELQFQLQHQDTNNDGSSTSLFFEGDLIRVNTYIDLTSSTAVFFANYGVTNRLDLGIALPLVSVELAARAQLTIDRLATSASPGIHRFPDGSDQTEFADRGDASGLGDILLRAKYQLSQGHGGGLAAAIDLRLPTGKEEDLLGTGATQTKLFLIGSATYAKVAPHFNLGYTFSSGGSDYVEELPDEFNYTFGFDAALHSRLTFAAELIGRTLQDADRLVRTDQEYRFVSGPGSTTIETITRPVLGLEQDNVNLLLGSVGIKLNFYGTALFSANLLFPMGDDGLQDDVIPLFGIDATF